jgi:uncharacterized membrane protein YdjX (TVP38/TMEM64 family)
MKRGLLEDIMNNKKKFTLFVGFLLLSLIIAIVSGYLGFNLSSLEKIVAENYVISVLLFTIIFVILICFSFSATALLFAGILFFSIPILIISSMIGIMGGAIFHYFISKKLGKDYIRNYLEKRGGKLEKFDEIVEKNNFKTILILSAAFIVPPLIPNLLGGIMKINLKRFSIATFLGNLPNTIFTIYFVKGVLYSNPLDVYVSIIGIAIVTIVALYFYKGELKSIFRLSFPWMFRKPPIVTVKNEIFKR